MLNEKLDNLSSIGNRQSVVNVLSCMLHGTTSLVSLQQYLFSKYGTKVSDTLHIVLLLESMGLIHIDADDLSATSILSDDYLSFTEDYQFADAFLSNYIDFLLVEGVLDLSNVKYDLLTDTYKLPRNSFKYRHSAYRNLLISFDALMLRSDNMYSMSETLSSYLHRPGFVKKLTQKRLKEILEAEEKMGEEGEQFVLQYESYRLGDVLSCKVKQISVIDVAAGFDIASFNTPESKEYDRYIEVKTYKGEPHFHWSKNEKDKAALLRDHYFIYLVDYDRILQSGYSPQMIQDPIKNVFESPDWNKTIDSYLIERTYPEEMYQNNLDQEDD